MQPKCRQVCKFVKEFRPQLFGVCAAGVEVSCKLVQISAHPAALGKQGGNGGQGFFATTGNLNQLARHFNSGGADTEQIRAKLLDELADLTAFRLHAEKVLGELYGNAQAYRL